MDVVELGSSNYSLKLYSKALSLFEDGDYLGSINYVLESLEVFDDYEDISLSYLILGFMSEKLDDNFKAIENFSDAITYEKKINLNRRSKDISYHARSNMRYKLGDYQGAIEDKRKARELRSLENYDSSRADKIIIEYKNIILNLFENIDLDYKNLLLIKTSRFKKNKYDLINDFRKVISSERKDEIINKLEIKSESKFIEGDFKASIKAIRRAERYY